MLHELCNVHEDASKAMQVTSMSNEKAIFGDQARSKTSNFDEPSNKIWSIYVNESDRYDRSLVESWKGQFSIQPH